MQGLPEPRNRARGKGEGVGTSDTSFLWKKAGNVVHNTESVEAVFYEIARLN